MIRLEGFHKHCITLEAGEGVAAGQLVTITGDDTAATATSGGFAGLALAVRNGKALVQVTGYMKVPMASAELTKAAYGYGQIAAAAGGKAATVASGGTGRPVLVAEKDSENEMAGIILL